MPFARNFKEARNKSGISQEELARKLHISRQAISRYENGTAEPSIDMLNEISVILETSIESLIGSKKEIPKYKDFESLSKSDKIMLVYDFIAINKWNMHFLPFIYLMCMNVGVAVTAFGLMRYSFDTRASKEMYIFLIIGAVGIIAGAIFLLFHNSMVTSMKFNRWLKIQHGLLRQKKLMIISLGQKRQLREKPLK